MQCCVRKLWLGEIDCLCCVSHCSQLVAWEMQSYQTPDQCFCGFEDSSVNLYLQPICKQHILTDLLYFRVEIWVSFWYYKHVRNDCIAQLVCDWTLTRVHAECRISPVSAKCVRAKLPLWRRFGYLSLPGQTSVQGYVIFKLRHFPHEENMYTTVLEVSLINKAAVIGSEIQYKQ